MSRELTGKHRYRLQYQWFRQPALLILQLEEHVSEVELVGGFPERQTYTRWRDARVTDLPSSWSPVIDA
jgi:hypothetical protein